MTLQDLEKKYAAGVKLLRARGYYEQVVEEIHYLVKYFNTNYFLNLLTENIFDDIKGSFRSFIQKDLRDVYETLQKDPTQPLHPFLEREYSSLTILKSCATNVKYQVSGLMRFEQTRKIPFKSSFLEFVRRKLNGEIQEYYKELSTNYKLYFRQQFASPQATGVPISLQCIHQLNQMYQKSFIEPSKKFQDLAQAIQFVEEYFMLQLRNVVQQRVVAIFYERKEKMDKLMDYFIGDLKKNFIRTLDRQLRRGKSLDWIQKGFLIFLDSERFETLLRKVLYQSLAFLHYRS